MYYVPFERYVVNIVTRYNVNTSTVNGVNGHSFFIFGIFGHPSFLPHPFSVTTIGTTNQVLHVQEIGVE